MRRRMMRLRWRITPYALSQELFQQGDELAALADTKLLIDGAEMIADRRFGYAQARSDGFVGQAHHGKINQLSLPVGQRQQIDRGFLQLYCLQKQRMKNRRDQIQRRQRLLSLRSRHA